MFCQVNYKASLASLLLLMCFGPVPSNGADPLATDPHYKEAVEFIRKRITTTTTPAIIATTAEIKTIKDPDKARSWSYALRRLVAHGGNMGEPSASPTRFYTASAEEVKILIEAITVAEIVHGVVNGWYDYHFCQREHQGVYGSKTILPGAYSPLTAEGLDKVMEGNAQHNAHMSEVFGIARAVQIKHLEPEKTAKEYDRMVSYSAVGQKLPTALSMNYINAFTRKSPSGVNFERIHEIASSAHLTKINEWEIFKTMNERRIKDLSARLKFQNKSSYLFGISPNGSCAWYANMMLDGSYGYYEPYDYVEHMVNAVLLTPWSELVKTSRLSDGNIISQLTMFDIYHSSLEISKKTQKRSSFDNAVSSMGYADLIAGEVGYKTFEFKDVVAKDISQWPDISSLLTRAAIEKDKEFLDSLTDDFLKKLCNEYPPFKTYINAAYHFVSILRKTPLASKAIGANLWYEDSLNNRNFCYGAYLESQSKLPKTHGFLKLWGDTHHASMLLSVIDEKSLKEKEQIQYYFDWVRAREHEIRRNTPANQGYVDRWAKSLAKIG